MNLEDYTFAVQYEQASNPNPDDNTEWAVGIFLITNDLQAAKDQLAMCLETYGELTFVRNFTLVYAPRIEWTPWTED